MGEAGRVAERAVKEAVELPRPAWLPEGWRVTQKVRQAGSSAGTKDKVRARWRARRERRQERR